jgi:hypothetical protein
VITISTESDDEQQAVMRAFAALGSVLDAPFRVVRCYTNAASSPGGGRGGVRLVADPPGWQMPVNVYSPPEDAWRDPSGIQAAEQCAPAARRHFHTCSSGTLREGEGPCPACDPA